MLPVIEVLSTDIDERSGRNERGLWLVRRQTIWVSTGEPHPEKFEVSLEEKQPAYPVGKYVLGIGSFQRGKYGLELARNVRLVSLAEAHSELSRVVTDKPSRAAA
ncbi:MULTISPECIES: G5P family DNA-binding protein [Asaia]|uniref:Single-stranded DNA-binding protein n=2 Tax=Pseudomonadati TaxID=3379134 RepID=A0ABX2P8R1_9PROT|nr:G5P family DNA-binding protein [Asaia spathodeae]GBR16925.1 hypothetical protein AA105894_1691 [Asaia spathodeae NBRC 105894]